MLIKHLKHSKGLLITPRYLFAKVVVNKYLFFVDFKGMLYFDDDQMNKNPHNLIKDKKFTQKFYQSLKSNHQDNKSLYPYMAQFWGQKNYLRSAISPIIYHNLQEGHLQFSIGLKVKFNPESLYLDKYNQLSYDYNTSQETCIKGKLSNKLINQLIPHIGYRQNQITLAYDGKIYVLPHQT